MEDTGIRSARRWELLAVAIQARMAQLHLNRQDLAARTGISAAVIGDIANGTPKNYRPRTLAAVAEELDWHPLAAVAVLASDEAAANLGIDLPAVDQSHDDPTTGHGHMEAAA